MSYGQVGPVQHGNQLNFKKKHFCSISRIDKTNSFKYDYGKKLSTMSSFCFALRHSASLAIIHIYKLISICICKSFFVHPTFELFDFILTARSIIFFPIFLTESFLQALQSLAKNTLTRSYEKNFWWFLIPSAQLKH